MKLRYLFSTILASALMLIGCTPESIDSFENIKLSQTYLSIPVEGGSATVTVTATGDWAFVEKKGEWPKCMGKDKDGNEVEVDAWLTVDKMSGNAGETVVTFTAGKAESGREFELEIKAGNNTQFLRVRQGSLLAEMATCAEIIAGPDGKNYKAKGICTSIASDYYGNWYLNDGTGEVYVYGTVNADGEYDWASFGIEVGDSVYVEGPKKTYNGTIELVNVTVSKVVKALLALPEETGKIEKIAQDHTFKVAYKGKGVFVEVGDKNAKDDTSNDWITYKSMDFKKGVPSKLEPNPADTAFVTVSVAAVPDDLQKPRNGFVTVKSYLSEKESTAAVYTIKQMGHTPALTKVGTLAQANVDEKSYVRVEGNVAAIYKQGYVLADETGAVLIQHGNGYDVKTFGIGDKVLVQGTVAVYNFGIQISPDYEEVLDDSATMTYPESPVEYDGAKLNALLKVLTEGGHGDNDKRTYYGVKTEYATMVGTLSVTNYVNLEVEGADQTASIPNALDDFKLKNFNEKKVLLTGYVQSVSCSSGKPKYVNMILVSVEEYKSVIWREDFKEDLGDFTMDNKTLPEGSTYVWKWDKYEDNAYAKASGYVGGKKVSESWLVSPLVDLTSVSKAFLSFEHAGKFFGTPAEEGTVWAKTESGEWTKLAVQNHVTNSDYTFVNSGKIDLSAYVGGKMQFAFRYTSSTAAAGTWEIKNVVVER